MSKFKKGFILLIGGTVILFGLALIILPGPGLLVIFLGLAILATEFAFAEKILGKAKGSTKKFFKKKFFKKK